MFVVHKHNGMVCHFMESTQGLYYIETTAQHGMVLTVHHQKCSKQRTLTTVANKKAQYTVHEVQQAELTWTIQLSAQAPHILSYSGEQPAPNNVQLVAKISWLLRISSAPTSEPLRVKQFIASLTKLPLLMLHFWHISTSATSMLSLWETSCL